MSDPKGPRLNSVDMSRWGGELTATEATAIWNLGVHNIKVGDGWSGKGGAGEWARQQASVWLTPTAIQLGATLDAYVYLYMAGDPVQQVANAFATLDGFAVRIWWLDAEDVESPELTAGQRNEFLIAARNEVQRRGGRCGAYTGRWWWVPNMENGTVLSDLPLWDSYYDKDPATTGGLPYGGWTVSAVEQYDDTQYVGGQSVDVNYDKTLDEEEDMAQEDKDKIEKLMRIVAGWGFTDDDGNRLTGWDAIDYIDTKQRSEYEGLRLTQNAVALEDEAQDKAIAQLRGLIAAGKA